MHLRTAILFILLIFLASCKDEPDNSSLQFAELMEIPEGFPEMSFPEENEFTTARWELGKRLFYDKALSVDNSISCASCHKPGKAFSDDVALSLGVEDRLGNRNSPTLTNVGYHPYLLREGGIPTLEMQILVPLQEHNEFDFNIVLLAERIGQDQSYVSMAAKAYDREIDAFVITRALACFERSLISGNSRYDQYFYQNNLDALSDDEHLGRELFFGEKTNCSSCHSGFNFTNFGFENNGLYENYIDAGRARVTDLPEDFAKFKIPTLRNIEFTAPYMHDGSVNSLEEVIDHYNKGGENNEEQSPLIKPMNLTDEEKSNLLAFLKTLSDESFLENPLFRE